MFVDFADVRISAGNGGNGVVSFRQEKFVDRGGPDGGDGGHGGNVIFEASRNQNTLSNFRYQKLIKAPNGANGFKQRMHGKSGADLIVKVPVGTVITRSDDSILLADLTVDGQQVVAAVGGKGGFGNAHFVSSTRQAPRLAEKGEPGEDFLAHLELKMIADIGLIGLPNAGKSTLLARLSHAKPEIADYPFTTLTPNLGVVDIDDESGLLLADIPGLIEGASQGKGLGDDFLRHIERTKALVQLIDIYIDDLEQAYKTIQSELQAYKVDLSKLPQIVALTKIDGMDEEMINDRLKQLKKFVPKTTPLLAVSAQSGQGLKELLYAMKTMSKLKPAKKLENAEDALPVISLKNSEQAWRITKGGQGMIVSGPKIERFARRTDFTSPDGVRRLRDIMRKMGIMHELKRRALAPGTKIIIGHPKIGSIEY